jgi:cysteinyl-tRNA synthetase
MDDDLDTPAAVRVGFDLIRRARASEPDLAQALAAAVFQIFEDALGLPLRSQAAAIPPEVLALVKERDAARAAKDFTRADQIRAELEAQGWIVEDGPDGTTIRR